MTPTTREIDIKAFARDVENVCKFFLDKLANEQGRNGSDNLKVIEDLANTAADIHTNKVQVVSEILEGLSEYMKRGTL